MAKCDCGSYGPPVMHNDSCPVKQEWLFSPEYYGYGSTSDSLTIWEKVILAVIMIFLVLYFGS